MAETDARLRELTTLNAVHDSLNREPVFATAVQAALEQLIELARVRTGWIFTTAARAGDVRASGFRLAAAAGLPPALEARSREALVCGTCECQRLFSRGSLERGVNMVTCSRLANADGDREGLEMHASVPLLAPSGPVGILNLASPGHRRFDRETLSFLAAVGKAIGTAFERNRLQQDHEREARYAAVLEERQRLARDMHDSLSQLLFAADLSVGAALQRPESGPRIESLEKAAAILADAQKELRGLVAVLRPAHVDGGLEASLERLAKRTNGSVRVHFDVTGNDAGRLAPDATDALFRIAQEAVHNALRHAGAAQIRIVLGTRGSLAWLEVIDDGVGIGPESRPGMGSSSMEERAREVGATYLVETAPGKGTTIRVEVPLSQRDGERLAE